MKEIRNNNIKSSTDSESRLVEGYAVVFNSRSVDLGGFYEIIDGNALDGVLEKSDVLCLLDHNTSRGVLARSRGGEGSLTLKVDDYGLFFSFEAPNTSLGDEILEGVKRGDISSCSFAFTVDEDEYSKAPDGAIIRTVKKINQLYDISLVYNPAYESTNVDTRGFDLFLRDNKDNTMTEEDKEVQDKETDEVKETETEKEEKSTECEDKEETRSEEEKEDKETDEETSTDEENKEEVEDKSEEEEKEDKEERNKETTEQVEKRNNTKKDNKHNIMDKKFRLIDSINDVINNRSFNDASNEVISRSKEIATKNGINFGSAQIVLSGLDMNERSVKDPNGILAQEATFGEEAVPTEIFDITGKLRDKMVLTQAGARFINATANLDFVSYSGSTCGWGDEIEEAVDGSGKFTSKKLTPRRLCAVLPISKTWLAQADGSAEQLLRDDIVNAVSETLQKTILGSVKGDDVQPEGLMYDVATDTKDFTYGDVVDIEKALEEKNFNVDSAKWIVSPSAKALMRNTKVDAGSGRFVYEDNEILGVPAYATSSMVENGVVYGDFNELIIANWNSMSILVDPYSLAAKNQVRLVINYYVNYILRREDALVKRVLKKK